MNEITIAEIKEATCGTLMAGCEEHLVGSVCTDSRKAKEGDLFVPIIGEVHDAHKFIPQVIEKRVQGAADIRKVGGSSTGRL